MKSRSFSSRKGKHPKFQKRLDQGKSFERENKLSKAEIWYQYQQYYPIIRYRRFNAVKNTYVKYQPER